MVTGASGFIGSFLVEGGLERGMQVWAGVRKSSSRKYLQDSRISFAELDFTDSDRLEEQLKQHKLEHGGWDYIIHCAGVTKCREVIAYLEKLRLIIQYLGASDCKLQEGSMRADVNLSVREAGVRQLGIRTEMKNLNSFKAIARAIAYEARRQAELLEEGRRVVQETRRWDDNKDATFSMRSKEDAQDYRYFPEPDIPPLELSEEYLEGLRAEQPEMAEERKRRYQTQLGLPEYDAGIITGQKALVDFFEEVTALGVPAKEAANWMLGDMMRRLKEEELEPKDMRLTPTTLVKLIGMVQAGRINRNTASKVFRGIFAEDLDPEEWVTVHGLEQIRDERVIAGAVARVLEEHPQSAADYRAGKEKALGFLMGRVMKELKGKADPGAVNALLKSRLETGGSEGG